MNIAEQLFLSVSTKLNVRVTPENLRVKMEELSSVGGVTSKIKTDMLIELLLAIVALEKKIDDTRNPENTQVI